MNYRTAFFVTVAIAVTLAVALLYFSVSRRPSPSQRQPSATQTPAPAAPSETPPQQAQGTEPNLSPVQLSPQRLQSIGVKFAEVTREAVHDEIRVAGNVEVNEERLAYVQTRFPGWIQKV